MGDSYSVPRQIWRIAYPVLIYFGIQITVPLIIGIISVINISAEGALGDATLLEELVYIFEQLVSFIYRYSMQIMLLSHLTCVAVFLLIWRVDRRRNEAVKNKRPVVIAMLSVGFFAGFNLVLSIIFSITGLSDYAASSNDMAGMLGRGTLIAQILAIGVVMPVSQELLFRGILICRMNRLPVWAAVILSSVFFGAAQLTLFQGINSFIAGVLLALLYVKFRSVIIVIAAHAAFNIVTFAFSVISHYYDLADVVIPALSVFAVPLCAYYLILHPKPDGEHKAINTEQ